jgi:putative ABC transport system permease protein
MSIINYIQLALKALIQNRVRTMLTLLGIIIGIGSVISLMALSNGATMSINSQLSSFGTNNVTVSPGARSGAQRPPGEGSTNGSIEQDALERLENKLEISNYDAIFPFSSVQKTITYKDKIQNSSINGVASKYYTFNSVTINEGRIHTISELEKGSSLIVVPTSITDKLFGTENPIGKSVSIENNDYEVIGTTSASGVGLSQAILPISQVQDNISKNNDYSSIQIVAKNDKAEVLKNNAKNILLKYYDVDEDNANFSVQTTEGLLSSVNTITSTLSILLVAIGGISLIVGGIGIMNIMLVTVSERTKEIGLRKAVGAKINDILIQFLTESIIITMVGGLLGIIVGWLVSFASTNFFNFPAPITTNSVLIAVGVSSAIGIIFGFYPAYKASKLQPIDALKSE